MLPFVTGDRIHGRVEPSGAFIAPAVQLPICDLASVKLGRRRGRGPRTGRRLTRVIGVFRGLRTLLRCKPSRSIELVTVSGKTQQCPIAWPHVCELLGHCARHVPATERPAESAQPLHDAAPVAPIHRVKACLGTVLGRVHVRGSDHRRNPQLPAGSAVPIPCQLRRLTAATTWTGSHTRNRSPAHTITLAISLPGIASGLIVTSNGGA